MLVLAINTVGDACEAALVDSGEGVIASLSEPMQQGHDARLAPIVEALLRQAKVAPSTLDRVAVVVGPGSFTGVRVGVAFARGLALATGKPAVGVTSLEALDIGTGRVLGLLAAKRRPPARSWWAQILVDGRGVAEPVEVDEAGAREMAAGLPGFFGDIEHAPVDLPGVQGHPTAIAAGRFVLRLAAGDLPPARPIYVRAPDAAPAAPPVRLA